MRKHCRVLALISPLLLSAGSISAQLLTAPQAPALVIDAVIEYLGPPGTPTFEAPADNLVNQIKDFWSAPSGVTPAKGQVVAAAVCDALGGIREVSIVSPSPSAALNAAALNAMERLKTTPLSLAAYPPNRRRLIVTFYYNAASAPGPVTPPPDWPPRDAFRTGNGVTLPRVVREVQPRYTRLAMQARIQGGVLIEGVVGKDGTVGDAIVVRSLDRTFGLDREALDAMKQWQFVPGTRMGQPVAVVVTVELTFTLK